MITSHSYLIISEKVNDVNVFVQFLIHTNYQLKITDI